MVDKLKNNDMNLNQYSNISNGMHIMSHFDFSKTLLFNNQSFIPQSRRTLGAENIGICQNKSCKVL